MRHYTCDGCGSDLSDPVKGRYALTVSAHAAHDRADQTELTDADLDRNVVEETAALLRALEDGLAADEELTSLPNRAAMDYDLCAHCFGEYLKDPIGRSRRPAWAFSAN